MIKIAKQYLVGLTLSVGIALSLFAPTTASAEHKPLKNIHVTGMAGPNTFIGKLSITELTAGPSGLLASGEVSGKIDRRKVRQAFYDVPLTLSTVGNQPSASLVSGALALSPDEPLVCDLLFLDLGPLSLDLLGLDLDLAEVILDLDAVRGPGNLVGNLLCAVTGLLDVLDLGVLLQGILEAVLDALNDLL